LPVCRQAALLFLFLTLAMQAPPLRLQVQDLTLAASKPVKAWGWGENQATQGVQRPLSGRLITPEKEIGSVRS
jgi:hypothetical protein